MKRILQIFLAVLLFAGIVGVAYSVDASAAKLDLLLIGPIASGSPCQGISRRQKKVRQAYFRRMRGEHSEFRLVPTKRLQEVLAGNRIIFSDLAGSDYRMAREIGRKSRADLVLIADHEFKQGLLTGPECHVSFRLVETAGSDAPLVTLAKTKNNARKENGRKIGRALNELLRQKARTLIAQVLARKGGASEGTDTARRGGGRPKLLVIGPMDGNLQYNTSTEELRSKFVKNMIPTFMSKFEIISGEAALAPLRTLPEAKGLDLSHFFNFDRVKDNNYRLARKFGKALDTDFVVILARDSEKISDGGSAYLSFVDVNDQKASYEGSATRRNFTRSMKNFLREFVLRSRKGIERAVARRGGGLPKEVQVARLPKAERQRKKAEEKRQEEKDKAEIDRLRRERELARMEIETLRKERERMAAERKKLEDLRGRQPIGEGKTMADLRREQPAAIFLRRPKEGESTENPSVRLNAAVTSPVDIQKIEVFLNGVHQFRIGKRELKKGRSRQYELSNFIRAKLGANELKVVATTKGGVRSERIVRFTRKRPVGNIYAVVIGVNKYKNVPVLRYAVGDAKAFADYLTGHLGVPKKNVTMMLDEKVTLRSLRTTLGVTLRKAAGPKDTVIIYYAGHGGTEPDDQDRDGDGLEKYLLPHDADPEALFGTAMSMGGLQSVFRRIRSERLVFIADACYSGAAGGRTIMSSRRATVSDKFMNRLSKGKGRIILSAAGANQVAQEDQKLGHGVFTYHLIRALKGAGDKDGDGYVSVDEAYDYVSKAVPKATGQSQTPVRKGSSVGQLYIGRVKTN